MSATEAIRPVIAPARGRTASVKRGLAILLLPASIIPLPFLGPTLLRAPHRLYRQASADVQRLLWPPGQRHGPLPPALAPVGEPSVSPAVRRGGTVALPSKRSPR
jgi:hypothetical protein